MNSALEFFQHLKRLFSSDFAASLSEESFLYRLLVGQRPEADVWRQHINECLELAYRYNLVDADLEGKLKKGDWKSWQATINELEVAKFLEDILGDDSLRWRPKGRKGKVGEFKLVLSKFDKPIFVEVKTVFPRELEKLEEHIKEKLCYYTKQVPIPFVLNVSIKEVGNSESFSGRNYKDFLKKELLKINVRDIKGKPFKLPDYADDRTGLNLEVEASPTSAKRCYIGIIGGSELKLLQNEDYIQHSLKSAYTQRPEGNQPFLVILRSSTEFPIEEDEILNVLLGTVSYRIQRFYNGSTGEPEPFRKFNGFTKPQYNRQLSAIGLYRGKFTQKGTERNLEIYHNPFAANRLNDSIFKGKDVRQLVKVNDTGMGWID